ncbi:MAG: hypothetical protein JWQ95_6370 [Sphaerisporangium sp.]|jgi:hypothetical protein|nr:hypothetical protein [Sphaerisporangium sp.]
MLKTRALGIAAAAVTAALMLSGAPANAGVVTSAADAEAVPTALLVEMTTPQNQGVFYTASPTEAARAEQVYGFKRTLTPAVKVATKPFANSVPLYRLKFKAVSSYILANSKAERDRLTASGQFVYEGVAGYLGKTGDEGKRLYRFHLDNQSKWRVATSAHKDIILKSEPGWTLDGPVGYLR